MWDQKHFAGCGTQIIPSVIAGDQRALAGSIFLFLLLDLQICFEQMSKVGPKSRTVSDLLLYIYMIVIKKKDSFNINLKFNNYDKYLLIDIYFDYVYLWNIKDVI